MRLQHASVPDLRAYISSTAVGRELEVSRATATFMQDDRRELERWLPLDSDVAAWRMAAATVAGTEFIRQRTGQASALQYVAIVDDGPWSEIERSVGAAPGGLLGVTTADQAGVSRVSLPRSGAEQASSALDALARPGATIASLTAEQRRGVQFLTGTTLHEDVHVAAYSAPRIPGREGFSPIESSPFTESLAEATADSNSPAFLRSLLGDDVGDISRGERDAFGYAPRQVEPSQRLAALADPDDVAATLLRVATTVPVGEQAHELARAAAPGASESQRHDLATAITALAAHDSPLTSDAFAAAIVRARAGTGAA